jgi:glycosyltransferase involved in cell wall biosynthesis
VDVDRFHPPAGNGREARAMLRIPQEAPVIGLVSKPQPSRRFEVIWAAAAKALEEEPDTRFVLLGTSDFEPETVEAPLARLGIADRVIRPGYLSHADGYVTMLSAFDLVSLLMPGTDGTARAVREASAMGIPSVVSDYGMLPGMVEDGRTGLVVRPDADALANAWLTLIRNSGRRREMGRAARALAESRYRTSSSVLALEAAYRDWCGSPTVTSASR